MRTRKKICAGNWKMYKSPSESRHFLTEWSSVAKPVEGVEVVVFPPAYNLFVFCEKATSASLKYGAQNCHFANEGAFTGESSPEVIRALGASYVLVGHSERRTQFLENNELLSKKIAAAMRAGLIPLYCIGETREQRDKNQTQEVLRSQLVEGLSGVIDKKPELGSWPLVIAYEPVWAIGTGQVATPDQVEEAHKYIRHVLIELLGDDDVSILYGGSVKPDNAPTLIAKPNVDGFLVGGASLKPTDFMQILAAF